MRLQVLAGVFDGARRRAASIPRTNWFNNHRSLVEALSSGDAEAAEGKMRAHIHDAGQVVMQAWAQWQAAQEWDGTVEEAQN